MFGSDDITWCGFDCNFKECFRNPVNMQNKVGLHSFAMFQGTPDCVLSNMEVTTKERGWVGHFICGKDCLFRRNTLITCGDLKWIVSTVGNLRYKMDLPELQIKTGDIQPIGYNRWYETMVFESLYDVYDDADVQKHIDIDSDWGIWGETWEEVEGRYGKEVDNVANDMHDRIVNEMKTKIKEAYANAKIKGSIKTNEKGE